MKPIFLKIGLFLLSGIVFFCGCQTTTKDDPESLEERAAVSLPFMTVSKKELTNTISIPGHVSALPDHSVVVTPHIIGKIKRMSVVPGQRVEKGQIIAELDDRQIQVQLRQAISPELAAEAAVAQAEAEHAFAGKELERLKDLFEGDLAAKKDVVLQETNLKTAAAKLAAAKAKLEEARSASDDEETLLGFTKIRSPISGVVAERFLNIGDEATPNKPIVHLVDLHEVVIDADMPADIPLNVNLGHRATVRSVANPKIEYEGIVISISPLVHNQSNTVKVRLKCLNRDGGLREGQTVSVSLTTGVVRQAISVPRSSVLPDPDDPFSTIVYTVKSGKSRRVRVKTGLETSDSVEIIDGLKEGDTVIVSGSYGLPEGVEVKEAVTAVDE